MHIIPLKSMKIKVNLASKQYHSKTSHIATILVHQNTKSFELFGTDFVLNEHDEGQLGQ